MSDAHKDPAVLVSSRLRSNPKVLKLPIEGRWAWVVMLGEAKLHRPPGMFESRDVLDYRMAELAPMVDLIIAVRPAMVHTGPYRCSDCRDRFGPVGPDAVLIHNWHTFQGRSSTPRVQKHRALGKLHADETIEGGPSEHELKRLHPVSSPVSETPPETVFPPRAMQSQSIGSSSSSKEEPAGDIDPLDEVDRWLAAHRIHGSAPGSSTYTTLARLADQHGAPAVVGAFETLLADHPEMRDAPQFVFGARNLLNPIPNGRGPVRPPTKGHVVTEALQGAVERV